MNFLDIVDATYYNAGGNVELSENSNQVVSLFKKRKKTVFILIDGMGALVLNNLLPNSFLNSQVKDVATTVFPSTTSVVLTSLATGKYPATHSVNGWFSYVAETNESIIPLPFINRFESNEKLKIKLSDFFYCTPRIANIPQKFSMIAKSGLITSEYSKWFRNNTTGYGYRTLKGAFQTLSKLINKNNDSEFIYLYIDDFDATCHKYGPDSNEARELLKKIDTYVEKYAKANYTKANTIITADHGQVRIKTENFFTITNQDEIMDLLKAPPSADSRFVCFHVKDGKSEQFKEMFNKKYGKYAELLSQEELDSRHILGPEYMCERAKLRFGDFCAIFDKEHAFGFIGNDSDKKNLVKGCHSGASDEEMKIPLIVIN